MPAVGVDVHFDVGDAFRQHGGEILIGPDGMTGIVGTCAGDKGRRHIGGNGRRGAVAREGRRAGIDDAGEIGPRTDAGKRIARVAVLLVEIFEQNRRGGGKFGAGREAHDADLIGIEVEFFGMGAHHADGLKRVVNLVRLRIVAVTAEAIAQNHRIHAVIVEKRHEIGRFGADIESIVPAAGGQDDGCAGVHTAVHGMDLDRRIVDGDDAVDAARNRLAHVVNLGLGDLVGLEVGRSGREQSDYNAAGQDGRGCVRRVGFGSRFRDVLRCGEGRQDRFLRESGQGEQCEEEGYGFHNFGLSSYNCAGRGKRAPLGMPQIRKKSATFFVASSSHVFLHSRSVHQ